MDQEVLVKGGRCIATELETQGFLPRVVMWVQSPDTDTWKLWILPHKSLVDTREFYRHIASIVSKHRSDLSGIDTGDIELVTEKHPVLTAMKGTFRVTKGSTAVVQSSTFNGFYLANAIILQMDY